MGVCISVCLSSPPLSVPVIPTPLCACHSHPSLCLSSPPLSVPVIPTPLFAQRNMKPPQECPTRQRLHVSTTQTSPPHTQHACPAMMDTGLMLTQSTPSSTPSGHLLCLEPPPLPPFPPFGQLSTLVLRPTVILHSLLHTVIHTCVYVCMHACSHFQPSSLATQSIMRAPAYLGCSGFACWIASHTCTARLWPGSRHNLRGTYSAWQARKVPP